MNVLFGADSLLQRRSGVGRMTLEIVQAARANPALKRTELLLEGKVASTDLIDGLGDDDAGIVQRKPIPWRIMLGQLPGVQKAREFKYGWLNKGVNRLAKECGGRLVYHELNMIAQPLHVPTVVTFHDLSWHHEPSWHPEERLRWIDRHLPTTLRRARRFVAISQFTKDAMVSELGVPADRIDVAFNAPSAAFRPISAEQAAPVLARLGLQDQSYVFSISTLEPRKNFDRLLAAHLRLPPALRRRMPLVIAGGKGWGDVLARPEADAASRDGTMRLLGHVTDSDLVALCARAAVFAYVSLYEGFGLPVVEAMAAACPVLASSTTAVGEVAADAALLVDPLDEDAIAAGLTRLLEDPAYADTLRQAGLARAAEFTWERTVESLVGSWRRVLG